MNPDHNWKIYGRPDGGADFLPINEPTRYPILGTFATLAQAMLAIYILDRAREALST